MVSGYKLNSLTFNGEKGKSFKKAVVRILKNDGAEKATLISDCLCKTIVDNPIDVVAPKVLGCIFQNLNVTINKEIAKSPIVIGGNVSGSVEDILTPDGSSLEELENFIDRSFKGVGCLPLKNDNIFLAQSIDSSTPSRSSFDIKSGTLEDRFKILKAEMESCFLYLKAEISEQTKIINACKQDICTLSDENLILKLRLSELEEKGKVCVNKSIPHCEEKSQMTAPIEDNDENALTYYIDEHPTIVGSQDHNNKSNFESFRVIDYVEKPPSGKEVPPLTKENGVHEEKNPRSGLDNEAIGPLNNENIALKPQRQNDKAYRKSLTPCPFLVRRGWYVKGDRCDFLHPSSRRNYHKHDVLCSFLHKNGICLKGNNCDFFHGVFPYAYKRSRPGPVGDSHPYNPLLVSHQIPAELIPPRMMQSQPYYPQGPRYVHPQPWPRPLMEVPVYPPFPYRT